MHYVLLIHAAESRFATMPPADGEAILQAYGTFTQDLYASGRAGDCAALEPTHTATSVRVRDGKRAVQDGPFAETREQLGGYYVVDVPNEEDALALAAQIPDAKGGTIEVRPVAGMPAPPGGAEAPAEMAPSKDQKEYVFLIYEDEQRWSSVSPEDAGNIMGRYRALGTTLRENDQWIAADRLEFTKRAKSVSLVAGARVVRDGPFAETREQLGGYYRVRAKNLDEAIELAARLPGAETGTVEIRPVMDTSAYA